jgi:hypothetical protein
VVLITLVVAGFTLFAYDRWFVPQVVAIDLKGYLRTQQALLASGEITETQWQQGLDRLEQVFRAQPPNHTILLKEVVLKNGREPELRIP